jgi:hypothetical protein
MPRSRCGRQLGLSKCSDLGYLAESEPEGPLRSSLPEISNRHV